jgi:non-specific serine/threonine protein kinase
MPTNPNKLSQFWQEFRRRKVLPFLIGYIAACFAIIEFFKNASERYSIPDPILDFIYILAAVGLPIVIVLPWFIYRKKPEAISDELDAKEPNSKSDKPATPEKSIIVLPFENISPDPDQEYFSDGLTEEIISDLSHIHELLVISRSSAMTFKGTRKTIKIIASEVNVRYVLEGSVRKAGNKLRITAQLIDALSDTHLWAEKYNGLLDDVFDIQEKVSQSITDALELQLSGEEKQSITERPFRDVKAYEYYLKARQEIDSFTEEGVKRAIQYLESALKIVEENDVLYAGLSYAWWQYFNIGSKKEYLDNGLKYAGEALRLNPDSSEGHFVTGNLFIFSVLGKIKKGVVHLRRALEVDPNNSEAAFHLAGVYLMLGKTADAAPLIEKQLSIDPLNFYGYWASSVLHLVEGRYEQALRSMTHAHELVPGVPSIDFFYSLILMYNGHLEEAFSIIDESKKTNPDNVFTMLGVFLKYALQGNKKEALQSVTPQILEWSSNDLSNPWYIVAGYSLIGEKDEALKWLEKWIDLGFINYPFLSKHNTFLENIRGEERFKKLMERVKYEWENFEV